MSSSYIIGTVSSVPSTGKNKNCSLAYLKVALQEITSHDLLDIFKRSRKEMLKLENYSIALTPGFCTTTWAKAVCMTPSVIMWKPESCRSVLKKMSSNLRSNLFLPCHKRVRLTAQILHILHGESRDYCPIFSARLKRTLRQASSQENSD